MLNKLILIENLQKHQFEDIEQLIEYLMGDNYYNQTEKQKNELMKLNAMAKCLGTNLEILELKSIEEKDKIIDVKNKFILYDEKTYILSLLLTNRVTLLEHVKANILTDKLDKTNIQGNYIIVNKFAEEILHKYINKI